MAVSRHKSFEIYSRYMGKVFSKGTLFGFVLVVLLAMSAGGAISAGMMTMEDGTMTGCPYMGMTALCNMSPLQHLSEWQSMTTATPQEFFAAALLLIALAILSHFIEHLFAPKRTEKLLPRVRYRERVFDPLRLAFARGIIHPKVF